MLTPASRARLLERIDALVREFADRHNQDLPHPPAQREMVGLLVAMRAFDAPLLEA